jgi:hypothetical protein
MAACIRDIWQEAGRLAYLVYRDAWVPDDGEAATDVPSAVFVDALVEQVGRFRPKVTADACRLTRQ